MSSTKDVTPPEALHVHTAAFLVGALGAIAGCAGSDDTSACVFKGATALLMGGTLKWSSLPRTCWLWHPGETQGMPPPCTCHGLRSVTSLQYMEAPDPPRRTHDGNMPRTMHLLYA